MRLPSPQHLLEATWDVVLRFPLVVASALAAFVGAGQGFGAGGEYGLAERALATGVLGLPLAFAVAAWRERSGAAPTVAWASRGLVVLLLVAFFLSSPRSTTPLLGYRLAQFLLAAHLLAAVLPWWGRASTQGFWQYNRTLFTRFLVAALFAAVLFAGLALALVALDQLFGVDVDDELYKWLFFAATFLFHPLYFLRGVPEPLSALEGEEHYPLGLKVFAQYILLPLVSVYLLLLLAYLGRVLLLRDWPSGWIGWLVSWVSVAGVLSLLLLHPARQRAGGEWVDRYRRVFHLALLPALGMLLVAAGQRIGQYGLTEPRYFLVVLASWMAAICAHQLLRSRPRMEAIPASLCVVALFCSMGPWGAYATSRRSQAGRLQELMQRNGLLEDGAVVAAPGPVPREDRREMGAVLDYLLHTHGSGSLEAVWDEPSRAELEERGEPPTAMIAMDVLGLEYVGSGFRDDYFHFDGMDEGQAVDISGHELAVRLHWYSTARTQYFVAWGDSFALRPDPEAFTLRLERGGEDLLVRPLRAVADSMRAMQAEGSPRGGPVPGPSPYVERHVVDSMRLLLVFRAFSATLGEEPELLSYLVELYLGRVD